MKIKRSQDCLTQCGQEKSGAVVLAAGQGKRMKSSVQKQYLSLGGKPVLWYSLNAFEQAGWIDEIILVVPGGEERFCREEIIKKYGFQKVTEVIAGGRERYESVAFALRASIEKQFTYIYIHDGARPFLSQDILTRARCGVEKYGACVVGMPSKDTVKIADRNGMVQHSPDRSNVWSVQTPQVFRFEWAAEAYEQFMAHPQENVTDDAMVVERYLKKPVALIEGSYRNMKITTPEDLVIAEALLQEQ